jgi:MFS family permease
MVETQNFASLRFAIKSHHPTSEGSPLTPLRSALFRRLWYSSLASASAQAMERTVTAWLTLESGGGAFAIGLTFAARMLPSLLFGVVAGTVADRADRPRQLLAVAGAGLLLMALFSALIGFAQIHVWQIVLFSFAAGCVQVFDTPARQALVLDIVPREAASRALAVNALGTRVCFALGAFGVGLLIPLIGVARCYLLVAVAYGLVALLAAGLRVAQEHRSLVKLPPFRQALRDAGLLVVNVPAVRLLIVAGLVCEVFAFSHMSALPILAQDVLRAGPEGLGTLNGAASVGGAISVLLLALLPGQVRHQPVLGSVFLAYGLAILVLAATHQLIWAAAIMVLIGMCAAAFDVLQQTLIQLAVPTDQRARAVGLWVLSIGSAPLGHLEMGLLVAALGAPGALLINGTLTIIAAVTLLAYAPDYRLPLRRGSSRMGQTGA